MSIESSEWDQMLEVAKLYQQDYYEFLTDWTKYQKNEYKYLRQNIGFALYGPPSESEDGDVILKSNAITDNDITTTLYYKPKAEEMISLIYNKICEFGEGYIEKETIYYGIIYNLIFRTKNSSVELFESKKENDKKDSSKEKQDQKDSSKKKQDKEDKNVEEDKIKIYPLPIFKVKRSVKDEIWYIDINGRVYKSWIDYKECNTLPPCTMVLPMNGFYQPDQNYVITEEYSTVWLEVLESPACNTTAKVLSGIDIASNVIGGIGLGLCIASAFTPAGPLVIGAAVSSGVTGTWTISRSVQNLVDRSNHEESISLTDRNALGSWLGITGSAIGFATIGGNAVLTSFIKNGSNIGTATRVAYNALILSNLGINGFGLAYQAYCLYERYQEGQPISYVDVTFLATHILFFGNSVINLQFAGELIETTQGRILDDYRATLRSRNMRKKFNRAKRNAATNNVNKISENAEVIRYINKRIDLQMKQNSGNISLQKSDISIINGHWIIKGICLLDPMKFVDMLINNDSDLSQNNSEANTSSWGREDNSNGDMFLKLKRILRTLLDNLSLNNEYKNAHVPDVTEFDGTLRDMLSMKDAQNIFVLIFKIAVSLTEKSSSCSEYLANAVHFIWQYVKESLKQTCLNAFSLNDLRLQRTLCQLITVLFDSMDATVKKLLRAFEKYVMMYLSIKFS